MEKIGRLQWVGIKIIIPWEIDIPPNCSFNREYGFLHKIILEKMSNTQHNLGGVCVKISWPHLCTIGDWINLYSWILISLYLDVTQTQSETHVSNFVFNLERKESGGGGMHDMLV